jgi:hypothetical protein
MTKSIHELVTREDLYSLEPKKHVKMVIEKSGKPVFDNEVVYNGPPHPLGEYVFLFEDRGHRFISMSTSKIALNGDKAAHCDEDDIRFAVLTEEKDPKLFRATKKIFGE